MRVDSYLNVALKYYDKVMDFNSKDEPRQITFINILPPYYTKLISDDGSEDYLDEEGIKKLVEGYDLISGPAFGSFLTVAPPEVAEAYSAFSHKKSQARLKAEELIRKPLKFKRLVKKDPSLVINDYVVQLAIKMLQVKIASSNAQKKDEARTTLEIAGIPIFIPKFKPYTKHESPLVAFHKAYPGVLYLWVQYLIHRIYQFYNPPYYKAPKRGQRGKEDKYNDIKTAHKNIYGKEMPDFIKVTGERNKDATSIALTFIASYFQYSDKKSESKIPFDSFKEFYFNNKKQIEGFLDSLEPELELKQIVEDDTRTSNTSDIQLPPMLRFFTNSYRLA